MFLQATLNFTNRTQHRKMAEQQSIYFDSTYTLRVVEEDKFKDTERLKEECDEFTKSECASCHVCETFHPSLCALGWFRERAYIDTRRNRTRCTEWTQSKCNLMEGTIFHPTCVEAVLHVDNRGPAVEAYTERASHQYLTRCFSPVSMQKWRNFKILSKGWWRV